MNSKQHIVILHPHFTLPGGAGKVALEQAEILSEQYRVTILCIKAADRFRQCAPNVRFIESGGALTDSAWHWAGLPLFLRKIRASIRELQPDIIFPHVFPANWWAWNIKKHFPSIPCIWYCHEPSAFIHYKDYIKAVPRVKRFILQSMIWLTRRFDIRLTRKYCDGIITNSDFTSKEIRRIYNRAPDIVIPPIIDDIFVPLNEHSVNSRLIMASRLNRVKNISIAVEAMAILPEEFALDIAGEGESKEMLMQEVKRAGLENRVKFIGEKSSTELSKLYSNSLCLLALSENESFGIAAVESLACGTPVIAASKGALTEMIKDGRNGILLPEVTPKEIASAAIRMKSNKKKYLEMRSMAALSANMYRRNTHTKSLLEFFGNIVRQSVLKRINL